MTSGDPSAAPSENDPDPEATEMAKAVKEFKPQQQEASDIERQRFTRYVKSVEAQCSSIKKEQVYDLKTGYSILSNLKFSNHSSSQINQFNCWH